ncbi:MAG: flagellar basal body P-ring formation chaperone FlgA, partial [Thermodesulfobacteriota bacterium]|nr:flagellar basal body P-ring formation chaperone FlgA [Thermodesulfobacteriota bacterium]
GSIPIVFKVNNTFEKKTWVTVEVDVFGDVVISPKHLGKSTIMSKEDVRLETRNLARLPRNTIAQLEDVIGKRTKRVVDANSVITTDMLDLPPVVRRGDLVTLIAETNALKITTLGEVRESAIQGETIRVLNVSSKKEIYGKVVDSSTVKVEF